MIPPCAECGRGGHALVMVLRGSWICEPCLRAQKSGVNPLISAPRSGELRVGERPEYVAPASASLYERFLERHAGKTFPSYQAVLDALRALGRESGYEGSQLSSMVGGATSGLLRGGMLRDAPWNGHAGAVTIPAREEAERGQG